jgi:hypothetical protein
MKRIKCSNPKCQAVFGHLLGNKMIDMLRNRNQITVTGSDFNIVGTCQHCHQKSSFIVEDGQLNMEDVTFKDDGAPMLDENGEPIPAKPADPDHVDGEEDALDKSKDTKPDDPTKNELGGDDDDGGTPDPAPAAKKYTTKAN